MKILASQQVLSEVFSLIQGIVEKNSIKPITSNALIEASENGVFLSATNLQIGLRNKCTGIQVIKNGVVSVNARKIFEIIKELPEQEICIEEKDNYRVEIACGKDLLFTIIGLPPEDFPFFLKEEKKDMQEWDKDIFIKMLFNTYFSISKDDTKLNICGAHFENIEGGFTRVVTTDGYRLSIVEEKPGSQMSLPEKGITVPHKAVSEIMRILNEKKQIKKINVCFFENMLIINADEIVFFIRLIEKNFPDYNIIIPGDGYDKEIIKLEKTKLKKSLKRISIISEENNSPVVFNFYNKELLIKTEDIDVGNAKEKILLEKEIKKEINFCLNCSYFLDVLNVVDDEIIIEYNLENNRPILIKTKNDGEKTRFIIMPMIN